MQRRDFLALTGLTMGGLIVPAYFGKAIAAEQLLTPFDVGRKKRLADVASPPRVRVVRAIAMCASADICASS